MIKTVTQIREELADREAIRDVLLRYCRASDRVDEDLLRSVYWPDAEDTHLEFTGNREEFIAYCSPILKHMRYNMHMVGNMHIAIDGDKADAETYFVGYHSVPNEQGERFDSFSGGRYLDNLEKRNDEWRIKKRLVTVEWFRDMPDTQYFDKGPFNMQVPRGDSKPMDVSYEIFKILS